jgi:glucan biosynthesis protein
MHWVADEPYPPPLARCVATRFGNGGQAGTVRPKNVRKFVVEFSGEPLARLPAGVLPDAVLSTTRGGDLGRPHRGRPERRARPLAGRVRPLGHRRRAG